MDERAYYICSHILYWLTFLPYYGKKAKYDRREDMMQKGRHTLEIRQNAQQRQCDPFNSP